MPTSGMAKTAASVATRKRPWTEMPTPPPITIPSLRARVHGMMSALPPQILLHKKTGGVTGVAHSTETIGTRCFPSRSFIAYSSRKKL